MTEQVPDPSVDNAAEVVGDPEPVISPKADKPDTANEPEQQDTKKEAAAEDALLENEELAAVDHAPSEAVAPEASGEEEPSGKRKLEEDNGDVDQPEAKKMNVEQVCAACGSGRFTRRALGEFVIRMCP
jgi:hypothetical protein